MTKLSIDKVGVNLGVAQIKTGEFFTVTAIDLGAKKATLQSMAGDEKIVGNATFQRWYRELTAEEVVEFGKMKKQNGGTSDEVPESNESKQDQEVANGENEAGSQEVENADAEVSNSENAEESGAESVADAEDVNSGDGADAVKGDAEAEIGTDGDADKTEGDAGESAGSAESEGVTSPITPSNAGKDKDKAKEAKESEAAKKNAVLMKVRQTIIDTILADSPSIQLKRTTSYDVLKEKHNFAEITRGSNRFNVSVMSKCLTEDQVNKVKINPASFGWSIDADFTVFDESDIETAVQLIRQSREYRLANPVTRKKKESK